MSKQVMLAQIRPGNLPTGSGTTYGNIMGYFAGTQVNEVNRKRTVTAPGTISNLRIRLTAAPGSGKSWTFTLRITPAATGIAADTALTCTISDSATTGSDLTHSVSVLPGDMVNIKITTVGTATASVAGGMSTIFDGTNRRENIYFGDNTIPTTGTAYPGIVSQTSATTERWTSLLMPCSGVVKGLRANCTVAPGAGVTVIWCMRLDGADTVLTCAIAGASATSGSDLTNGFHVNAGQILSCRITISGGTAAATLAQWGWCLVPDVDGEFMLGICCGGGTNPPPDNTYYAVPHTADYGYSTTEDTHKTPVPAMTVRRIYANHDTDGSPGTWTYTLRKNGASSALALALGPGVLAGHTDVDVACAADDLLNTMIVPTGSPQTPKGLVSYCGYIAPATAFRPRAVML